MHTPTQKMTEGPRLEQVPLYLWKSRQVRLYNDTEMVPQLWFTATYPVSIAICSREAYMHPCCVFNTHTLLFSLKARFPRTCYPRDIRRSSHSHILKR